MRAVNSPLDFGRLGMSTVEHTTTSAMGRTLAPEGMGFGYLSTAGQLYTESCIFLGDDYA